jgi:hypothetical protein
LILKKILLFLLLAPLFTFAQKRHHEMGVFGGTANYFGDLQKEWFPTTGYRPAGGLIYKYFTHPRFGYRFGATYTELTAADSTSPIQAHRLRNLNFTTNLFELHGAIELNMFNCDPEHSFITPYGFVGISALYFNPYTGDAADNKVYLKPLATEGQGLIPYPDRRPYNLGALAMPMGGGLKILFGKKVYVAAELGYRMAFTDYIDDVSRSFVNYDTIMKYKGQQSVDLSYRADELKNGQEKLYPKFGDIRGDGRPRDWYWFGSISVTLYFDSFGNLWPYDKTRCPNKKRIW